MGLSTCFIQFYSVFTEPKCINNLKNYELNGLVVLVSMLLSLNT